MAETACPPGAGGAATTGGAGAGAYVPWEARYRYRIRMRRDGAELAARGTRGAPPRRRALEIPAMRSPYAGTEEALGGLAAAARALADAVRAAGGDPARARVAIAGPRAAMAALLAPPDGDGGVARAARDALAAFAAWDGWGPAEPADIRRGLDRLRLETVEDLLEGLAGRSTDPHHATVHLTLANLAHHAADVDLADYPVERAADRDALPLLREPRVRAALAGLLGRRDAARGSWGMPGSPPAGAMAHILLDAGTGGDVAG